MLRKGLKTLNPRPEMARAYIRSRKSCQRVAILRNSSSLQKKFRSDGAIYMGLPMASEWETSHTSQASRILVINALDRSPVFRHFRASKLHEHTDTGRASQVRMGQDPKPEVDVAKRLSEPDQRRAWIAEETGQQRRPESVNRQLEHAVERIHSCGQPLRRDFRLDPPPARSRPEVFAEADERDEIDCSRTICGDKVATTIRRPSHRADPPPDQRFRGVIGQANGDVRISTRQVEGLIGKDQLNDDAGIDPEIAPEWPA